MALFACNEYERVRTGADAVFLLNHPRHSMPSARGDSFFVGLACAQPNYDRRTVEREPQLRKRCQSPRIHHFAHLQPNSGIPHGLRTVSTGQLAFAATSYAVPPPKCETTEENPPLPRAPITMRLVFRFLASSRITALAGPNPTM